jgi:hypothetical protein
MSAAAGHNILCEPVQLSDVSSFGWPNTQRREGDLMLPNLDRLATNHQFKLAQCLFRR